MYEPCGEIGIGAARGVEADSDSVVQRHRASADMITQARGGVGARIELAWRGEPWFRLNAAACGAGVITD
jgi:hypothetical protein